MALSCMAIAAPRGADPGLRTLFSKTSSHATQFPGLGSKEFTVTREAQGESPADPPRD